MAQQIRPINLTLFSAGATAPGQVHVGVCMCAGLGLSWGVNKHWT